jgi:hypothetical protein
LTVDSKPGAVRGGVRPAERDPRDAAGLLLGRLTVLPALVLLPFLLASFPLLVIGDFKPVPVIILWLVLAALIVPYVWRRTPSVTGAGLWGTAGQDWAKPTPRWALWALIAVSAGFGVFNVAYHSQFIIDEYDAASYMQFANWISGHGTTIIPESAQYFGGSHAPVTFTSAAFFQQGNHLVPQFMAGLPMVLATGFWAGGARLAVFWGPVLGALAVFTFGGLVARLVGPRWAPFAALAIAVSVPMQYTSRSTWSEPLALILLVAGLSVWIDSQHTDRGAEDAGPWRANWRHHLRSSSHVLAGVAGLLLGIVFLVRLDGPADIMLIIPFCGLLLLRRQRQVMPLMGGLIIGVLYGAVDCVFVTLPYVQVNKKSVEEMVAGIVVLTIGTAVALWWLRRRGSELRDDLSRPWLVWAVTVLPFLVIAVFLARPYVERGWVTDYYKDYAPLSVHWIYWYTGAATIAFAVLAYSVLGRRAIKREAQVWVLPLLVFACATGIFLLEPSITPHQPYASRRLVPAVLPGLILLATWMSSWLARKSRVIYLVNVPRFLQRAPQVIVTVACMAAIAVPMAYGNATGLALKQTFSGEISAMNQLCAEIPKNTSVLFIDNNNLGLKFAQAIRGTCDDPVATVLTANDPAQGSAPATGSQPNQGNTFAPATIAAAIRDIEASGHTPYVLAYTQGQLVPVIDQFGNGPGKEILDQPEQDDEHIYLGEPRNTAPETFTIWSWEPGK